MYRIVSLFCTFTYFAPSSLGVNEIESGTVKTIKNDYSDSDSDSVRDYYHPEFDFGNECTSKKKKKNPPKIFK